VKIDSNSKLILGGFARFKQSTEYQCFTMFRIEPFIS